MSLLSCLQVRYILGYRVPRVDTLYEQIEVLVAGRAGFQWKECVMGLAMLAFLMTLRVISKRVKKLHWIGALGPILSCIIGIAAVAAGRLDKRGIKIVEKIPQGACYSRHWYICCSRPLTYQAHIQHR